MRTSNQKQNKTRLENRVVGKEKIFHNNAKQECVIEFSKGKYNVRNRNQVIRKEISPKPKRTYSHRVTTRKTTFGVKNPKETVSFYNLFSKQHNCWRF